MIIDMKPEHQGVAAHYSQTICSICEHPWPVHDLLGTCPVCRKLQDEQSRYQRENDILRKLVPSITGKCLHCGVRNIARCHFGFPGCAWADDIMCAEDAYARNSLKIFRKLDTKLKEFAAYDTSQTCPIENHAIVVMAQDLLDILHDKESDTGTAQGTTEHPVNTDSQLPTTQSATDRAGDMPAIEGTGGGANSEPGQGTEEHHE